MYRYSLSLFLSLPLLIGAYLAQTPPYPADQAFQQSASSMADTVLTNRIALGAELYARICESCHNARGPAERTDREWVIIMQHMQTRANLTYKQARLVRDFLLASNDAAQAPGRLRTDLPTTLAPITDDQIRDGRLVYQRAGTCFACHGTSLEGTAIAPNLDDTVWKNGDGDFESILNIVRNGVEGTAMAAYPGGISDEQAQQVAAYVWAVSQRQEQP